MIAHLTPSTHAGRTETAPVVDARVLQIAFACHPDQSMESRNGWRRAVHAARRHRVTLLYGDGSCPELLMRRAVEDGVGGRINPAPISAGIIGGRLLKSATTYYAGLQLWHRTAFRAAKRWHEAAPFDLVHQTTYCGYREPGYGWKLGAPFIWGPIGGTHSFPTRFLGQLSSPRSVWIELCRNAINRWQLRHSRRVKSAARKATVVLAATRAAQADLRRHAGIDSVVQLETALDGPLSDPRPTRSPSEPLKLLWAGRLRDWKTLPLLLRALAQMPPTFDYRLRVMGVGRCERGWKRLAARLGVGDRIEWIGWPDYAETLPHYRWADVFTFTSMRDTSGTGMLEALASGAPVVAVGHQGAADIVNESCGLIASIESPRACIDAFCEHLTRLAADPRLWKRLSDGALAEASRHTWEVQADALAGWYEQALAGERAGAPQRLAAPDVCSSRMYTGSPANQQLGAPV